MRQKKQQPNGRSRIIAAIHAEWHRLRPDLLPDESRAERLAFISHILRRRHPVRSMCELTTHELLFVLDALHRVKDRISGRTPTANTIKTDTQAEVIHLASAEQAWAIERLFVHLGWTPQQRHDFLVKRFRHANVRMLTPQQANSLFMILATIAAARDIKRRGARVVSRSMIRAEIPHLKARLGIDLKEEPENKKI